MKLSVSSVSSPSGDQPEEGPEKIATHLEEGEEAQRQFVAGLMEQKLDLLDSLLYIKNTDPNSTENPDDRDFIVVCDTVTSFYVSLWTWD